MRFLARATFGDPMMQLVAIKEVVCAEYDRPGRVILKLEKGHAVTRCTTAPVQRAYARANAPYRAAKQPHDLDLVSDLVERDSPALLAVEFVGAMRAQEKVVVVEGEDHPEPAQLAARNDPMHLADVWIEGVRVADYEMQAGAVCRRNNLIAFLERHRQRLLDQNMLAVFHRFDRLTRVESMRRRDVDGVDGPIPTQIMKVRINRCLELASEGVARTSQRIHPGTERES